MPCRDVTELIHVVVDLEDRLKSYRFIKRTCGRGVGADTLLLDTLGGRTVDAILELSPVQLLAEHRITEPLEEFLALKHLIALQSALEVLTGRASGGPGEVCAAAEIAFEDGDTVIHARISVDLLTEEIKSCGNCRSCGAAARRKRAAV
ncbi:MAG TPA: hypothetical protein PKI11_09835 [Candidatus Hydrogenedentes bacterium]|nr:hypothetical protein [Candidatus Hydrogenedentota bacterium]HNT88264.1 hypothetical protein [Candidatus Hydrogenedentota bacterium]